MVKFLLLNYFRLSSFMNIAITPFSYIKWSVNYKISYNKLSNEQKQLSDKFTQILRENAKLSKSKSIGNAI